MDKKVKYCPNCGSRLEFDALFCDECGEKQIMDDVDTNCNHVKLSEGEEFSNDECDGSDTDEQNVQEKTPEEIKEEQDKIRYQQAEENYAKAEQKPLLYCKLEKEYRELGDYQESAERYRVCCEKAKTVRGTIKKKSLIVGGIAAVIIIIAVVLFFAIKTDAAKETDALIADIGHVTLESGEQIERAENAVLALSNREIHQLDNEQALLDARQEYDQLVLNENIKNLEAKIDAIGDVTLKKKNVIKEAREIYDESDEKVQKGIGNYEVLCSAEKELQTLRADDVEKKISSIGTVTLKSKKAIKKARKAYDNLNDEEVKLISNYDTLTKAEERYSQLKEAEEERLAKAAIAKMRTKTDRVENVTWYQHPREPQYTNTRTFALPYIGKRDSSVWLRWKFNYTGDDWIFWTDLTFLVDGDTYSKHFSYYDVKRDNGYGDVWEVGDIEPSSSDIELLKKIAKSRETIIRFEGDDHYYDLTVSSADKKAIKEVLAAYEAMK